MHAAVASFVAQAIEHKDRDCGGPFRSVLEIGGRNVNGGVRSLFGPCKYLSADINHPEGQTFEFDGTVTADGTDLDQLRAVIEECWSENPDCVVCTNVFEHVMDWKEIISNAYYVLIKGGWLIVTTPSDPFPPHSGIDGLALRAGEHYANISAGELIGAVQGYGFEIEMAVCVPPDSMVVGVKR